MKKGLLFVAIVVLAGFISGCGAGATTSSEVSEAAKDLQEKGKGMPTFNDAGVVKGGPGGGAALKPHR